MEDINFYSEQINFTYSKSGDFIPVLEKVSNEEKKNFGALSFIFTSDDYLLEINREYLEHDYYTDVITFDYSEENRLSGDIFISIDTVKKNSEEYKVTFLNELHRVMIHGVLHLIGYDDHTDEERAEMREREDYYLKYI